MWADRDLDAPVDTGQVRDAQACRRDRARLALGHAAAPAITRARWLAACSPPLNSLRNSSPLNASRPSTACSRLLENRLSTTCGAALSAKLSLSSGKLALAAKQLSLECCSQRARSTARLRTCLARLTVQRRGASNCAHCPAIDLRPDSFSHFSLLPQGSPALTEVGRPFAGVAR